MKAAIKELTQSPTKTKIDTGSNGDRDRLDAPVWGGESSSKPEISNCKPDQTLTLPNWKPVMLWGDRGSKVSHVELTDMRELPKSNQGYKTVSLG